MVQYLLLSLYKSFWIFFCSQTCLFCVFFDCFGLSNRDLRTAVQEVWRITQNQKLDKAWTSVQDGILLRGNSLNISASHHFPGVKFSQRRMLQLKKKIWRDNKHSRSKKKTKNKASYLTIQYVNFYSISHFHQYPSPRLNSHQLCHTFSGSTLFK